MAHTLTPEAPPGNCEDLQLCNKKVTGGPTGGLPSLPGAVPIAGVTAGDLHPK